MTNLKKKDILYYARVIPYTGIYEVCELSVRTVEDTYFVGTDKHDKHAYLFSYNAIGKTNCILQQKRSIRSCKGSGE